MSDKENNAAKRQRRWLRQQDAAKQRADEQEQRHAKLCSDLQHAQEEAGKARGTIVAQRKQIQQLEGATGSVAAATSDGEADETDAEAEGKRQRTGVAGPSATSSQRAFKITKAILTKFGTHAGCAGCHAAMQGFKKRAHSQECRRRLEQLMLRQEEGAEDGPATTERPPVRIEVCLDGEDDDALYDYKSRDETPLYRLLRAHYNKMGLHTPKVCFFVDGGTPPGISAESLGLEVVDEEE